VKDAKVSPFPGNLDDWLYHQRELSRSPAGEEAAARPTADPPGGKGAERERRRAEAEARNARYRQEKPVRDRLAMLEARIAELERVAREATTALADPALYQDFARARPHVEAQKRAQAELAPLYAEWEGLSLELERIDAPDP